MKLIILTTTVCAVFYLTLLLFSGVVLFSYEEDYSATEGEYYSAESMGENEKRAAFIFEKILMFPIPGIKSPGQLESAILVAVLNGACIGFLLGVIVLFIRTRFLNKLRQDKRESGVHTGV